ncbi:hypothetical protein LO772_16605 [Yinghuangia sp. ASG 101]|uniref:hypothetical protein n=1 Tax=Yinghuangia sp. ASG 101 TaxID=2896848 RepID=UPI001E368C7C|nr:hypothetical protein [Yinghuangia sp. ASG 101]UGQ15037.1 hypothetical protein LO772_16605 [Yinghuangia sp. ASG 101]
MLDGLDGAAWSTLGHAYGPAGDLPELLREAASEDEERRAEAVDELFGTVWHQGTVYSATPYAVPFVADLAERGPGHRGDMLDLLARVVQGSSDCGGDADAVEAGRRAVFELMPRLLGLIDDTDATVRRGLLRLVAACGPDGPTALPSLKERLAVETDAEVRADLVTVLSMIDPSADDRDERNRYLMADAMPAVRLAAVSEILRQTLPPYPTSLVAEAVDAYVAAHPQPEEPRFEDRKSFEDLLVDDPDAALSATARAAGAGSEWSLAWEVDTRWRDREVDVLPWYFDALEHPRDNLWRSNELYRIARAATAVPQLDTSSTERLSHFVASPDAEIRCAAVTALARARRPEAAAEVVRLIESEPHEYGTGLAATAAVEALGARAEQVAVAVAERLRSPTRKPTQTSNQEIALILALTHFPDIAATVVDELAGLVERGPCANAAALVLKALGRRAESARAVLSSAAQNDDFGFACVTATAHFRATGSPDVALDTFRRGLAGRNKAWTYGFVGELGSAASPLLPMLEAGLVEETDWARAGAAESIWRISGRTEDTLPVIAAHALITDGHDAAAHANAVRVLTDMRVLPEALLPGLHEFAEAKRRIVYDGGNDGTPHDDNVARAAVRQLLATATASPIPLADAESEAQQ